MVSHQHGASRSGSWLAPRVARRAASGLAATVALLWLLMVSAASPAAAWPGSPFDPRSPQASAIANLGVLIFVLSGIVFLVVEGFLFYAICRYRSRPGGPLARQFSGHRSLEIAWTLAPIALLAIVYFFMLPTLSVIHPPVSAAPGAEPLKVTVIGNQWWWEYRYPELGIVTANELHVPVGVPVELELHSDDVIHSYWVPVLNGKLDLVPGRSNTLAFRATEPGVYGGQCAEFCGIQHAWMPIPIFVDTPDQFEAWVRQQQLPARPPTDPLARRGQEIFLSKTCVNCHTIQGTPADGDVGPNLTHFGSRATIGTGVLSNTPENLALWIEAVQTVKPGARMTNFDLSEPDLAALVAYLESLQ